MFSYMGFVIYWLHSVYVNDKYIDGESVEEHYDRLGIGTMIFIIAIVIRFVMHIHSLRLVPGIGNFVITTFMMGTNLIHFSTVFGCVLFIFSILFYIVIDNPDCPVENQTGFTTITASMLSTFALAFGHGEFDPYFVDMTTQLTYVLYVIIVGLLLLNLIIAIMSTTAMEIMAEPWKSALWKMEWLDEATSVEYAFAVISLPLKRFSRLAFYSHKRAGYVVKKLPNKKVSSVCGAFSLSTD